MKCTYVRFDFWICACPRKRSPTWHFNMKMREFVERLYPSHTSARRNSNISLYAQTHENVIQILWRSSLAAPKIIILHSISNSPWQMLQKDEYLILLHDVVQTFIPPLSSSAHRITFGTQKLQDFVNVPKKTSKFPLKKIKLFIVFFKNF